jgi:hypothetical protein
LQKTPTPLHPVLARLTLVMCHLWTKPQQGARARQYRTCGSPELDPGR